MEKRDFPSASDKGAEGAAEAQMDAGNTKGTQMNSAATLKMKQIFRKKCLRGSSRKPLMEKNNNRDAPNGPVGEIYENPMNKNRINAEQEQRHQKDQSTVLEFLPRILGVSVPADPSDGQTHCSVSPGQSTARTIVLMQAFWAKEFLEPPVNLDLDLDKHLRNLQQVVFFQLKRLAPLLEPQGLMGYLSECCHRHTFDHLQTLLHSVHSCRSYFVLMNWARHAYMSHKMLSSPDIWILNEWETKAKAKLLENVQREVKGQIQIILQRDKNQECCNTAEDYVALYVDAIQCLGAMPAEARKIDIDLCDRVWAVCFQELLDFVKQYVAQQKEVLEKKAKADRLETIHFLKTLRNCKELRTHIQRTQREDMEDMEDTLLTLRELEDLALKLQTDAVAIIMERNLKKYFKSDSRRFFPFAALEEYFPKLPYVQDEHKTAMNEIYKVAAHIYFKHLIGRSVRSLRKCWSGEIEQTVLEDARELHAIVAERAPDVHQWNRLLLAIPEVLTGHCIEGLKITMATIQKDCQRQREDLLLLRDLLRWKGLSKRDIRAVMEALPDSPPPPASSFGCFRFCCY